MRQVWAMILALAPASLGCLGTDQTRQDRPGPPAQAGPEVEGAKAVVLDFAVIECAYGHAILSDQLWQWGDEQGIDLDVQPVLEENGLRVCRIGGLLPAGLQALLASPRHCPQPHRMRAEVDKPSEVPVGPAHPRLDLQYRDADNSRELRLERARCLFEVVPSAGEEGEVKLRFRPRVRHGKALLAAHVDREPGGPLRWSMAPAEPMEDFPALAWELTARPDELLFVGARLDRPGTLGPACFVRETPQGRRQTVLVVRARVLAGPESNEPHNQAPLAAQASLSVGRGHP